MDHNIIMMFLSSPSPSLSLSLSLSSFPYLPLCFILSHSSPSLIHQSLSAHFSTKVGVALLFLSNKASPRLTLPALLSQILVSVVARFLATVFRSILETILVAVTVACCQGSVYCMCETQLHTVYVIGVHRFLWFLWFLEAAVSIQFLHCNLDYLDPVDILMAVPSAHIL